MIRAIVMFSGSLVPMGCAVAEGACFRTAVEALRGAGVEDVAGYRVQGVVRDQLGGVDWAQVVRCGHPGWPVLMVRMGEGRPSADAHLSGGEAVAKVGHREVLVRAGAVVTIVSAGQVVRMEVAGTAVESGAAGQRVRVRVGEGAEERMLVGVVQSANVLEMAR